MKVNPNLAFLEHDFTMPECTIAALQGGTRSGKTYAVLMFIIRLCKRYKGLTISIVRQTFPALRATAMRDFIEILEKDGLYSDYYHNKSENTYNLWGNTVEFFAIDDEQKVRGRKRDLLFVNEANEITYPKFTQLLFRTTGKVIIDYNPSMNDSYIYDHVLSREDCKVLITTYKDNPHLSQSIINEIERLRLIDPEGYKVFGQGQRGNISGLIFRIATEVESFPIDIPFGYGMDFGFTNDPTTLVKVAVKGDDIFFEELLYQTGMTTPEITRFLKTIVTDRSEIIADSAEPRLIEEIRRSGFNIFNAIKGPGSITQGIDAIKRYRINVVKGSVNLLKEFRNYKYKTDSSGKVMNEPIDYWNHAIDAGRYRASFVINSPKLSATKITRR